MPLITSTSAKPLTSPERTSTFPRKQSTTSAFRLCFHILNTIERGYEFRCILKTAFSDEVTDRSQFGVAGIAFAGDCRRSGARASSGYIRDASHAELTPVSDLIRKSRLENASEFISPLNRIEVVDCKHNRNADVVDCLRGNVLVLSGDVNG